MLAIGSDISLSNKNKSNPSDIRETNILVYQTNRYTPHLQDEPFFHQKHSTNCKYEIKYIEQQNVLTT